MKKKTKSPRNHSSLASSTHHCAAKNTPKIYYNKTSLFPSLARKVSFFGFVALFIGYCVVSLLDLQTKPVVDNQKMIFSLDGTPEDWGFDSSLINTHGAASNEFDFLFSDQTPANNTTGVNTSVSGTISPVINSHTYTGSLKDSTPLISSLSGSVSVGVDSSSNVGPSSNSIVDIPSSNLDSAVSSSLQENVSCSTPWGDLVDDNDFILAYEQRIDVNSLCNVQKRYCTHGKLAGSYIQKSCKEDLSYIYTKVVPVAENISDAVDPFIQPNKPTLSGATFDTHGKLITQKSQAIDNWSDSGTSPEIGTGPYVTNIVIPDTGCVAPWGENIPVGQFVKAYKTPIGLIDMPCEVEIRLCTKDSALKGYFKYNTCSFKNMTYSDYLLDKGEDLTQPNIIDMANVVSLESQKKSSRFSLWRRFSKYF